jgi:hypothetical protein
MKKQINLKTWLIVLVVLLAVLPGKAWAGGTYSGGTGEPNNPYRIETPDDLNDIGNHVEDFNKCFVLVNDINLSAYDGDSFNVIGSEGTKFTGSFDGNGHTIANFTYSTTGENIIGLFGWVGSGGEIKNLGIVDANVDGGTEHPGVGNDATGCLVGANEGTISGCYATGKVSGYYYVGGLVGATIGTITKCSFEGTVLGHECVGGFVGSSGSVSISMCCCEASVSGWMWTGGFVGFPTYTTISDCYSGGDNKGMLNGLGGIAGELYEGTISNCYSTVRIGSAVARGGLVGINARGTVTNSFWDVNSSGIGVSSGGGEGKTTAEMQTKSTFADAGWDFVGEIVNGPNDIWRMCIDGVDYPKLWWEFVRGDFVCPDGVDFTDFAVVSLAWLSDDTPTGDWNPRCDISEPPDGIINELDLAVFTDNWLAGK